MNKRLLLSVSCAVSLMAQSAFAGHGQSERFDYAKVVSAQPIYRQVSVQVPRQECWVEQVAYERNDSSSKSPTSMLLGAVIGGAIGHAVGRNDRRSGTAIGAVLGGSIGNDIGNKNRRSQVEYHDEERCETRQQTHYEDRLSGYDVTYRYKGEDYTTRMDQNPGKRIRVAVSVRPVFN